MTCVSHNCIIKIITNLCARVYRKNERVLISLIIAVSNIHFFFISAVKLTPDRWLKFDEFHLIINPIKIRGGGAGGGGSVPWRCVPHPREEKRGERVCFSGLGGEPRFPV